MASLGIVVVIFSIIFFSVYIFRKPLSWMVWKNLHFASVATALNGTDAGLFFDIGNSYFGDGKTYDIRKAKRYFVQALELDDTLPGGHYQLARIYFLEGNMAPALAGINKEIELYPDYKRSHYIRGLIYGYMREFDLAASDFNEFLAFRPDSWAGHNDLAWIYFQMGQYDKALATADAGLHSEPRNMWLLNSRGVALLNLGREDEAKMAFEKALSLALAMTPQEWGLAYPGNNPEIYPKGLASMQESIRKNLSLLDSRRE